MHYLLGHRTSIPLIIQTNIITSAMFHCDICCNSLLFQFQLKKNMLIVSPGRKYVEYYGIVN